jgi:hypothetical protein
MSGSKPAAAQRTSIAQGKNSFVNFDESGQLFGINGFGNITAMPFVMVPGVHREKM